MTNNPNELQVGGTHYQAGDIQHWDIVADCYESDYFAGNISKYICRWRNKGGIEDLHKARHYLNKARCVWPSARFGVLQENLLSLSDELEMFISEIKADEAQRYILRELFILVHYPFNIPERVDKMLVWLTAYIDKQEDEAAEPTSAYVNQ